MQSADFKQSAEYYAYHILSCAQLDTYVFYQLDDCARSKCFYIAQPHWMRIIYHVGFGIGGVMVCAKSQIAKDSRLLYNTKLLHRSMPICAINLLYLI